MATLLEDKKQNSLANRENVAAKPAGTGGDASPEKISKMEGLPERDGLYKSGRGGNQLKVKSRFRITRRAATIGLGGGGIISVIIALFMAAGPLKIPSIIGGFTDDLPSGRMTRMIVERSFKRTLVKYLVAKKAGNLAEVAKPKSALGRLYQMFDAVDVERIIRERAGIEAFDNNGKIHIYHQGRDLGQVRADSASLRRGDAYKDWTVIEESDKAFAQASKDILRKYLPIFRLGSLSARLRLWMYVMGMSKGFYPIQDSQDGTEEGKEKNKVQEVGDEIFKREVEGAAEDAADKVAETVDCIAGGNEAACATMKRATSALEVTDPGIQSGFVGDSPDIKNGAAQQVEADIKQGLDDVKANPTSAPEGAMQEVMQKVLGRVVGRVAGDLIPVIGWIDVLAQLQHIADETDTNSNVFLSTIVLMREQQAGSNGAEWMGYADAVKDSKMSLSSIESINKRWDGYRDAAMVRALYHMDGEGVPVESKIGSTDGNLNKDLAESLYGIDTETYNRIGKCKNVVEDWVVANTGACATHAFLWAWYHTVSELWSKGVDIVFELILKATPEYWFYKAYPEYSPEKTQAIIIGKMVDAFLKMTGFLGHDPTASGAKLANSVGTGIDVILNRYMQTNLGARDVTNDPAAALAYLEADAEYNDRIAALPLRERLFSHELPQSMVNRLAATLPTSFSPQSLLASIATPIKGMPSTLMSIFTGKSWAAVTTAQEIANVDGVAQFGGTLEEIDADIPSEISNQEVENIKDLACPENADGFFNNCQRYKEVIQGAMCFDVANPCPEFQE